MSLRICITSPMLLKAFMSSVKGWPCGRPTWTEMRVSPSSSPCEVTGDTGSCGRLFCVKVGERDLSRADGCGEEAPASFGGSSCRGVAAGLWITSECIKVSAPGCVAGVVSAAVRRDWTILGRRSEGKIPPPRAN